MEGCEQVSDSSPQVSHAFNSLFVPGQNDLLFTVTTPRLFKKTSHKSFKWVLKIALVNFFFMVVSSISLEREALPRQ